MTKPYKKATTKRGKADIFFILLKKKQALYNGKEKKESKNKLMIRGNSKACNVQGRDFATV